MTNKIHLIPEFQVFDFKKSLDFYTRLAGFKILYERTEEDFAMLEREQALLMIEAINPNSRSWAVGPLEKPLGRGMHLQIEVSDVDALYQHFKQSEHPIFFAMEVKSYQAHDQEIVHHQFLVQDPDGYLLRFFSHARV